VAEHFKSEEDLLNRIRYPELPGHHDEHQEFRRIYKDLVHEYAPRGVDRYLALDTDKILIKWWEEHILKRDMAFAIFIKKEGWKFQ
jgi:hemerythrin-like metal-binding protein